MSTTPPTFRKASFSDANGAQCVEVAGPLDALRDSKNPTGPRLHVNLGAFLSALKSDRFDR